MTTIALCLTPILMAASLATATAQDRFVWRPNNTALRQGIPARQPSYDQYRARRDYDNGNYRYNESPRSDYRAAQPYHSYRQSQNNGIQNQRGLRPVFQFYHPTLDDQMLSIQPEAEAAGLSQYYSDGVSFYVSSSGGAGQVPLYRFVDQYGRHSFTTSRNGPVGAQLEHMIGYLSLQQQQGMVPLFGWYDSYNQRYVVSLQQRSDLSQDVQYLGVLGYVTPG